MGLYTFTTLSGMPVTVTSVPGSGWLKVKLFGLFLGMFGPSEKKLHDYQNVGKVTSNSDFLDKRAVEQRLMEIDHERRIAFSRGSPTNGA